MSTEDPMTAAQAVGRTLEAYGDLLVCRGRALNERESVEAHMEGGGEEDGPANGARATQGGTTGSRALSGE